MNNNWDAASQRKFIDEIRRRRALWDNRHPTYHDKHEMYRGWWEIAEMFSTSVATAKQKWKSLRNTFRIEVKKQMKRATEELPEGAVDREPYQSTWLHYDDMLFIKDVLKTPRHHGTDHEKMFEQFQKTASWNNNSDNNAGESSDNAIIAEQDGIKFEHSGMSLSELNNRLSEDGDAVDPFLGCGTSSASEVGDNKNKRRKLDYNGGDKLAGEQDDDDDNLLFFKSLIPYVEKLPDDKRLLFRKRVQQMLHNELYECTATKNNE